MKPARILVTGAEGFVGGYLLPALAAAFPAAWIIGTGFGAGAERLLDVTDRPAVFDAFTQTKPDVCIHLAGVAAIRDAGADPARAWAVNMQGSLNVAAAILAHAPACRLMFISSAECYGGSFASGQALDETAQLKPLNLYAETKAAAEQALAGMVPHGLHLLRLRPFNHTGPGQSEAFVVPAFAGQIARIEAGLATPVLKTGALTPERDFLDVRDVCAAYAAVIDHIEALPNNIAINIASGQAVKIGAILQMLLAQAACRIEIAEDPAKLRVVDIPRAVGNAGYARQNLGWQPRYSLAETLAAVLGAARGTIKAVSRAGS